MTQMDDEIDSILDRVVEAKYGEGVPFESHSKALGISRDTIKSWKRRGRIPLPALAMFAEQYRCPIDWLLHGDVGAGCTDSSPAKSSEPYPTDYPVTRFDLSAYAAAPRYDVRASAGVGAVVHSEQIVDHLAFRHDWLRAQFGVGRPDIALIEVYGDSMEPTLSNGDLVLIDTRVERIVGSSVYVLQHDGHLLVKRIQQMLDGALVIKSDNPAYAPEHVPAALAADVRVVGRVVWSGRRM